MRSRWWWVVALVPAAAGLVSIALDASGDFRSSGLMAAVSVSLALVAMILLGGKPWQGKRGLGRWLSAVPAVLLGIVALVGLSQGLPDFLQRRGLFIDLESVGPVVVVEHNRRIMLFGNDTEGGFAWVSEDGSSWRLLGAEALSAWDEVVDAVVFDSTVVVLGQVGEEAAVMISGDGEVFDEAGRFGNPRYGSHPVAVAEFGDGLVAITDIFGNDVEFYTSTDARSWTPGQPAAVFDDGENARDIACSDEVCVGVGWGDATYRHDLEADAGIAWISASGDDFRRVDHDFGTGVLDAIAWNQSSFLAVVTGSDDGEPLWQSADGTGWMPASGPFIGVIVDGVEGHGTSHLVFGRDPGTGALVVWMSEDAADWSRGLVASGLPEGSQIRSVITTTTGLMAVGFNSETLDIVVWRSPNGDQWQEAAVIATR